MTGWDWLILALLAWPLLGWACTVQEQVNAVDDDLADVEEVLSDSFEAAAITEERAVQTKAAACLALTKGGEADKKIADLERRLTILENVGCMK